METIFTFDNGSTISSSAIKRISREFFKNLKKELPEEALNYECIEFVIKEIETQIKSKKINL